MSTLATRLQDTLYEQRLSVNAFSKKVGISQQAISKIIRGETLTPKNIVEIATALGVDVNWLKTGDGEGEGEGDAEMTPPIRIVESHTPMTENTVRIEILDIEASAGNGIFLTRAEQGLLAQEFDLDFFREKFGRKDGKNLRIIHVKGDSMEPTLESGDLLYVDVAENYFSADGLYVFTFDDHLFIKRLQKRGREMWVISDNHTQYAPWEIKPHDPIYIHGRVTFSLPMKMKKW